VDSEEGVKMMMNVAKKNDRIIDLFIKIDVGLGRIGSYFILPPIHSWSSTIKHIVNSVALFLNLISITHPTMQLNTGKNSCRPHVALLLPCYCPCCLFASEYFKIRVMFVMLQVGCCPNMKSFQLTQLVTFHSNGSTSVYFHCN
jgi:hypothetical protein